MSTFRTVTTGRLTARLIGTDEVSVVDVRDRAEVQADGTLLLAVPIPFSELEISALRLVPRLDTPVVIVDGDGGALAQAASASLHTVGYSDVAVLDGGTHAWAAAGNELYTSTAIIGQAFGEHLDHAENTPHISVQEARELVARGDDVLFLDSRPLAEFIKHSLPQGISAPGAEIVNRGIELIDSPETVVVVNCAGRTRSIVGAQALINAGVTNPVYALDGGTMSWTLDGHELACGLISEAAAPSARSVERRRDVTEHLIKRFHLNVLAADAARPAHESATPGRTTFLLDVRTPQEYTERHVAGSLSTPSWDLAPWVFRHVGTLRARLVVVDDGPGLRAALTGSWLLQQGWPDVSVARIEDFPPDRLVAGPEVVRRPIPPTAPSISVADLDADLDSYTVLDVSAAGVHSAGRIPDSVLVSRAHLIRHPRDVDSEKPLVLVSEDGVIASLAAGPLSAALDRRVAVVTGGTKAWIRAGLLLETGPPQRVVGGHSEPVSPWQVADRFAQHDGFRNYLEWEIKLTEQLDRDTTNPFEVAR